MLNKNIILNIMKQQGKADAIDLRERAINLTTEELYAEIDKIPQFNPNKDYSEWLVGAPVVEDGTIYTLITPYENIKGNPSELSNLWAKR